MPVFLDIIEISDLLQEGLSVLEEDLDKLVEQLIQKGDLGFIDYGHFRVTLYGNDSTLDKIICKIYPVHAAKSAGWRNYKNFIISDSHLTCKLVTGSGGKEIWVTLTTNSSPNLKDKRNSELIFSSKEEAEEYIIEHNLLCDDESNALIKKFWDFLNTYAVSYDCEISLTCKSGFEESSNLILGSSSPWLNQDIETIIKRLTV